MYKKINGHSYNTSKARLLARAEGEELYSKMSGECFLFRAGHIEPLTDSEAFKWASKTLKGLNRSDALRKLPKRKAGERVSASAFISESQRKRLDDLRKERGFEVGEVLAAGIEALELESGKAQPGPPEEGHGERAALV